MRWSSAPATSKIEGCSSSFATQPSPLSPSTEVSSSLSARTPWVSPERYI
jgi:hypothetical protein